MQLQAYIRAAMPWYRPGGLTDERAWQVTSYVLKLNDVNAGPVLNAETAAKIRLAPDLPAVTPAEAGTVSSGTESAQDAVESQASSTTPLLIASISAAILLLVVGVSLRRKLER